MLVGSLCLQQAIAPLMTDFSPLLAAQQMLYPTNATNAFAQFTASTLPTAANLSGAPATPYYNQFAAPLPPYLNMSGMAGLAGMNSASCILPQW